MATDVDVQYFSHLNGLTLGNNWGDLIRLLDKALVTGIDFTSITAASIDAQGDVHITLYAAHNAMLFQIVELSGFAPASLNQKYRIKGVPSATELILKPHTAIAETSITTVGAGKLASLGYDIIFRDANDVKRVYRAKNPTAQHPFIRVDESLTSPDGTTGVYTSSYAKYAMVGLLEHMEHIDDFENPNVLQLPFDPSNPAKNWEITGTGTSVVRGWTRWVYARIHGVHQSWEDAISPVNGTRNFTLCGDKDAFYLVNGYDLNHPFKKINGCGLYNSAIDTKIIPDWFLMGRWSLANANTSYSASEDYNGSLAIGETSARFMIPGFNEIVPLSSTTAAQPILPDYQSGYSNIYSANIVSALEIPFKDTAGYLRGTLKHVFYNGRSYGAFNGTTTEFAGSSMFLRDCIYSNGAVNVGSVLFYLGEIE